MGIFSFFKKDKPVQLDQIVSVKQIGTDIHAHYLPGIDDGSSSIKESLEMIRKMEELGFERLICTPHVMHGHFQNSTTTILESLSELKAAVEKAGINVELQAAAEYNFDQELMKRLEENDLLTFGYDGYRFLLFELSYFNEPIGLDHFLSQLKAKGILPILAHPERYPYFAQERDKYKALKAQGVLFQINLNSLSGLYSGGATAAASWLIDQELVEFVGSDAHRPDHVDLLKESLRWEKIHKLVFSGKLLNPYIAN